MTERPRNRDARRRALLRGAHALRKATTAIKAITAIQLLADLARIAGCLDHRMVFGKPPLSAEESWYASGTFWAIVGVVVAVVFGSLALWAAFRSARPRRVLHVTVGSAVSLLRTAPGLDGRTEVRHQGRVLARPYVVTVDVVSRSALDIAAAAFGGVPLELEFGAPVVALLDQRSDAGRSAVREPKVDVSGTALRVGPAMLTRRHRLRYTVLLDGEPRFRPIGDLIDVAVHEQLSRDRVPTWFVVVAVTVALIPSAVIPMITGGEVPWIIGSLAGTGAAFWMLAFFALARYLVLRRRRPAS